MKRILKYILLVFALFIFNSTVYALELGIVINDAGTLTGKNALTNEKVGSSICSSAFIFNKSNRILTILEGAQISYIDTYYNITVTSNDSKVYINTYNARPGISLTLDHLNAETYNSAVPENLLRFSVGNDTSKKYHTTLYVYGNLSIIDSTIILDSNVEGYVQNRDGCIVFGQHLTITNSYVMALKIKSRSQAEGDGELTNSTIEFSSDAYKSTKQFFFVNAIIKDCKIENMDILQSVNIQIENTTINQEQNSELNSNANEIFTVTLKDTKWYTNTNILANDLNIDNSEIHIKQEDSEYLKEMAGYDYSTFSALMVLGSMDLKNNSIIDVESYGSVPAIVLVNSFTSDNDNLIFVDENQKVLELKKVNPEEGGFYNNPENLIYHFNQVCLSAYSTDGVYTLVDPSGNSAMKILNETGVKYTFKIKNGTWKDGSEEVVTKMFRQGETPNINSLVTLPLTEGNKLVFTKTGDNEYTYEYVENKIEEIVNPKTGVQSFILLLICSLLGVLILSLNKEKFDLFKKL